MSAQHSAATGVWYTPEDHIEAVRLVLGEIDLDPCSDEYGNSRIRAKRFISASENALGEDCEWSPTTTNITIYMNPPGGRPSLVKPFWNKLLKTVTDGWVSDAIVACFSIEQLQSTQNDCIRPMLDFPVCVCRTRPKWHCDPATTDENAKDRPTHAGAYVYVPGAADRTADFVRVFSKFGIVK